MMKQTILTCIAALAALMAWGQQAVERVWFDMPINSMRVYGDTIYVATWQDTQYYELTGGTRGGDVQLAVMVYDFVKWADRSLQAHREGERLGQNPQCLSHIWRTEPLQTADQMGYALECSADFGDTWWQLQKPMLPGRPQMAFNPQDEHQAVLYGMNEYVDCICPWMLVSDDGLRTLRSVALLFDDDRRDVSIQRVAYSPAEPGVLLAATSAGLARSADGGESWTFPAADTSVPGSVLIGSGYFADLCYDDTDPQTVYAVGEGTAKKEGTAAKPYDVYRSTDGGTSWQVIAAINVPQGYPMNDLQCHGGTLFCWALNIVYVLREARQAVPLNNDEVTAVDHAASATVATPAPFDLAGRRATRRSPITVGKGGKYARF